MFVVLALHNIQKNILCIGLIWSPATLTKQLVVNLEDSKFMHRNAYVGHIIQLRCDQYTHYDVWSWGLIGWISCWEVVGVFSRVDRMDGNWYLKLCKLSCEIASLCVCIGCREDFSFGIHEKYSMAPKARERRSGRCINLIEEVGRAWIVWWCYGIWRDWRWWILSY